VDNDLVALACRAGLPVAPEVAVGDLYQRIGPVRRRWGLRFCFLLCQGGGWTQYL